jgi:YVTN family beta-propeller protein
VLLLGAFVVGCPDPPPCLDLAPHADLPNHVQPFEVAVAVDQRRVYSTSLGSRTVAVIDADDEAVIGMLPVGSRPLSYPDIAVDEHGTVWVGQRDRPALLRFDAGTDERTEPAVDLARSSALTAVSGGGVLMLGFDGDDTQSLVLVGADGAIVQRRELDEGASWVLSLPDGRVGLILRGSAEGDATAGGLQLLELPTLEVVESCDLPFTAQRGAALDDGTVVVANYERIGLVGCGGEPAAGWIVGDENRDVVSRGSDALVLDRLGAGDGFDPNYGVARAVDLDGVGEPFATGKNTGYGAFDPVTGLTWVNSEGTTELLTLSTTTVAGGVTTGTFLDGVVVDPDEAGVVFATGRLSDTFVRIVDGEVDAETAAVTWPFSPAVDVTRDLVWVISQLDSTVHGHRRGDLSSSAVIDLGFEPNRLLTFSSLAWHPGRETLFLAQSAEDALFELDPDSGDILQQWDLGGPGITDWEQIGHLQVRVAGTTGAVVVGRSNDTRIQRVDPDDGSTLTVWLDPDEGAEGAHHEQVDFFVVVPKQDVIFVGGLALDANTLERIAGRDLDVHKVIGPHPSKPTQILAVDGEQRLVRYDGEGRLKGTLSFAAHDLFAATFRIDGRGKNVVMVRAHDAHVCWFPVSDLR